MRRELTSFGGAGRVAILALAALIMPSTVQSQTQGVDSPAGATTSRAAGFSELPVSTRELLAEVKDFTVDFDNPAFYAVLEFVAKSGQPPGHSRDAVFVEEWASLAERPNDFRGQAIAIEGVVGRNKSWRLNSDRGAPPGPYWQLELSGPRQPIAATVIFTQDAGDVGLDSHIRVTGYFVMMRQYRSESGRTQNAALIVAKGPDSVSRAAPPAMIAADAPWLWIVTACVGGLLFALLLLRRASGGRPRRAALEIQAKPAPFSLADELADWAGQMDQTGGHPPGSPPRAQGTPVHEAQPPRADGGGPR